MQHLAAYYSSVASNSALTNLAAVSDQAIRTNGNDIVIPSDIKVLLGAAFLTTQTGPVYGQLQSPTLREIVNQYVEPVNSAITWSGSDRIQWLDQNTRALTANENLEAALYATDASAADSYALAFLGDSAGKSTTGNIFTIRATAAATLATGEWVNAPLSFEDTLPAGSYQVVGARLQGANLIAGRFVFVGGMYRPGMPGNPNTDTDLWPMFRMGYSGVLGEFDVNQPPTMDFLGATDTSQEILLDLIKSK